MFDFNSKVNRYETFSVKYDMPESFNKPKDLLPLWIADMDFKVAPCIENALKNIFNSPLGYSDTTDKYYEAVIQWFKNSHQYIINKEWIVVTPGIVFALASSVKSFTKPGDAIIILSPVYPPFGFVTENNGRKLVRSSLLLKDNIYYIDFTDFEKKIIDNNVKMFILCSPHNPGGRIWTKEELQNLGDICLKHNVLIVSDEIHCDFAYKGHKHIIFNTLGSKYAENTILCTSPSKTFNIAGLQTSNIIIENKDLRDKFEFTVTKSGWKEPNIFGINAVVAAYNNGLPWLQELMKYLEENIAFTKEYLSKNLPQIDIMESDGTFLLWLNFNKLGYSHKEIDDRLINIGKVWLDTGTKFGEEGKGFQRLNIGCPRYILEDGLERIVKSFTS